MIRSTRELVDDLSRNGRLIVETTEIDPYLEMAEIQRRLYLNGGPAVLFENVRGCRFPMAANLFGSLDQARFIFRHTIESVRRAIEIKIDPQAAMKKPWRYLGAPFVAWTMLPKPVRRAAVAANECTVSDLPKLVSWPRDGGPFVTLPQVLSQQVGSRRLADCNLGMYRVQLSGNQYQANHEVGLHYQLHRGIGVHHAEALKLGQPFRVNITVGGSPAMTVAAVMPLPEGMSELTFAGALAGGRIPMLIGPDHAPIYADADFCIVGEIDPGRVLPEGPFGDHLGYYARCHDFPVLRVKKVLHRRDAIWPFTVVGRPPQEDTTFGQLIHEITGPIVPTVLPGVKAVHAVDAAGVHPLLLAFGSERYLPYRKSNRPQELLTQANAILGQGQMSLAKYLLIMDHAVCPQVDIHHIDEFLEHFLARVDWSNDLHFQTRTTIDTLDYSGAGFNRGSKVVMAARGEARRELGRTLPEFPQWPDGFRNPRLALPGVVVIESPSALRNGETAPSMTFGGEDRPHDPIDRGPILRLERYLSQVTNLSSWPLFVMVDDSDFASRNLNNFLWTTFTRSDPAADIYGADATMEDKHWGCRGPLIIDARVKPHHAPPLVEDPTVLAKVDAMASRGGPLARYL